MAWSEIKINSRGICLQTWNDFHKLRNLTQWSWAEKHVTRRNDLNAPGCIVVNSVEEALAQPHEEKFVIGGEEIFRLFMEVADRLYITQIHADVPGDAKFPEYDKTRWIEVSREDHKKDEKNQYDYSFVIYERKK